MNVVGLDYQRTLSVACLREGVTPVWPPVAVGDGRWRVIPNAAADPDVWGGDALARPLVGRSLGADEPGAGPWIGEGAASFWRGLARRVGRFLGGVDPARHVHRIAVAVQAADRAAAAVEVRRLSRQAGFAEPVLLSSSEAALVAFLADQYAPRRPTPAPVPETLAVVVVGDRNVVVSGFRLESDRVPVRVVAATPPALIEETGLAFWMDRLLGEVRSRCSELPADGSVGPALWQAALEWGPRLAFRRTDEEVVEWNGPLRERMAVPFQSCRRDGLSWNSVRPLRDGLPRRLADITAALGTSSGDMPIILAGVGALWPFAGSIAAAIGTVLTVDEPELAVARGAAWWPEIGAECFRDGRDLATDRRSGLPRPEPAPRTVPLDQGRERQRPDRVEPVRALDRNLPETPDYGLLRRFHERRALE